MTLDLTMSLIVTGGLLAAIGIVTFAALRGYMAWLAFRHAELAHALPAQSDAMPLPNAASRIEIADLRERLRKLEAIASGVDY